MKSFLLTILPTLLIIVGLDTFRLSSEAWGQDGCFVPTIPKQVTYPQGWLPTLEIQKSSDSVERGDCIDVWLETEGAVSPPFQWSVSGTGFHFGSPTGPTTAVTNSENEILHICADSTACGGADISVTEQNGYGGHASVIEPNHGQWVFKGEYCGLSGSESWYDMEQAGDGLYFLYELVSGKRMQFQKTWTSWMGHEDCASVPGICSSTNESRCPEDYRNNNCIDGLYADFYPYICEDGDYRCFCVYELKYYEWECP